MLYRLIFFACCFLSLLTSLAQTGTIQGNVIDHETGEPLIGSSVVIANTITGASSGIDGTYSIANLAPGLYDIQCSYISYQTKKIVQIKVKSDEITLVNIRLLASVQELEEIVVSAQVMRNSEVALMTVRKKSSNVIDGISTQMFSKIGDSHAGEAIRRIPGVSLNQGKYIYVRGLGDRYSKTMLNGVDIPSLDPNRNAMQIDIFPTNIIDNMVVIKSFTADFPADFTGGLVNIETKAFPEKKILLLHIGIGYNPTMHFNKNYITYRGGTLDFLGIDDGGRRRPVARGESMPSPVLDNPSLGLLTKKFNPLMATIRKGNFLNYNVGMSGGGQVAFDNVILGYNASLNYKNTTQYYDQVQLGAFRKPNDLSQYDLQVDRSQSGPFGENSVLVSGTAGVAIKIGSSKLKLNVMRVQNGKSRAATFIRNSYIEASNTVFSTNLDYSERSVTNIMLQGNHEITPLWKIGSRATIFHLDWTLSPTWAIIHDKDVRQTPYRVERGKYTIEPSEAGDPIRIWRFLDEGNYVGKFNAVMDYTIHGWSSRMKVGFREVYKQRSFSIDSYRLGVAQGSSKNIYTGNPDELLAEESVWTPKQMDGEGGSGTYIRGDFEVSNSFQATQNVFGLYLSNEINFFKKVKIILGVRMEKFDHFYTGQDQAYASGDYRNGNYFNHQNLLSTLRFFPAVSIIYTILKNMNVRLSYANTVARPSFKEKSVAQIFDPITDRTFIGNVGLVETTISNYDLRWDWFQKQGQNISFSLFYKTFINPIELVSFQSNPRNYQPRNVGRASVYGLEIEARKNLSFIAPFLQPLSVIANFSLIGSEVRMNNEEYDARRSFQRQGEKIGKTRNLQGQSPFLLNVSVCYDHQGWEAMLAYNVQGEQLSIVGINANPDVFTQAFHSFDAAFSKIIKSKKGTKTRISLGVSNILGSFIKKVAKSYRSKDYIFSSFNPGRTIKIQFSHSF